MLRFVVNALKDGVRKTVATTKPLVSYNEPGIISRQVRCLSILTKQPNLTIGQSQWSDGLKVKSPVTSILSDSLNKLLVSQVRFAGEKRKRRKKENKNKLWIPPRDKNVLFSLKNGKRITNKEVIKRFFRLHWGIWIRTRAGRQRRLWQKSKKSRKRLKEHVFTNATQSYMLDKMVTKFWKRPKYYVDDPYEPYHKREHFHDSQKKPRPLPEDC